jgi:hypothetical protein
MEGGYVGHGTNTGCPRPEIELSPCIKTEKTTSTMRQKQQKKKQKKKKEKGLNLDRHSNKGRHRGLPLHFLVRTFPLYYQSPEAPPPPKSPPPPKKPPSKPPGRLCGA